MYQKQKTNFYVKTLNQKQVQVGLNYKYVMDSSSKYFDIIATIVCLIDEKNLVQKNKFHDIFQITYFPTIQFELGKNKMEDEKCMICLDEFAIKDIQKQCAKSQDDDILMLGCSHKYHKICLLNLIGKQKWAKCPICSTIFGKMTGDQPDGTMVVIEDKNIRCEGYQKGTLIITYTMKAGNRKGIHFQGTTRIAYLPNNPEGRQVLALLKQAFHRKLIFTVGRSVTTGLDNQIVWNGIHHKTTYCGGAANFGYPDPTYLKRVKEELAFKGIKL